MSFAASFTCDLEPDCPPYLWGFRGVEHGMPRLLDLLDDVGVRATFFTTGDVARAYPEAVEDLVGRGHELGCHGMTHTAFTELTADKARWEIEESARILRAFGSVTSFRAPYLKFPDAFVPMLEDSGFELDSSLAVYKRAYYQSRRASVRTTLRRIPASLTSSALRLPKLFREIYLRSLSAPLVLFVHPWEFVDLRQEDLRFDCRFRTGEAALHCVGDVLRGLKRRGALFTPMRELPVRTA
jgi:peptidoglycan/xylan/chitin deacetylase (PgdA/CDA1 family)